MRDVIARLIAMLTPWYHEDDAARREQSTHAVTVRSAEARRSADALIASYRAADARLGRMSGR